MVIAQKIKALRHDAVTLVFINVLSQQLGLSEDAGAVQAARHLITAGYLSVKPLRGGYEVWLTTQTRLATQ